MKEGGKGDCPVRYDSHMHSSYSPDSDMPPGVACEVALRRGLSGVCFTDHAEFAPDDFIPTGEDLERMFRQMRQLRRQYRGSLRVGAGIEIGYHPGADSDIRALLDSYPFDFVLGSVHTVDGIYYCYEGPGAGGAEAYYRRYLEVMQMMVASIEVDAVGHFDLPKRFGPQLTSPRGERVRGLDPGSILWPQVERILDAAVRRGILLEVNGSGLRQPPREPYPSLGILRAYRAAGGTQVTLGSDAHAPGSVGWGLEGAAALAARAGISTQVFRDGGSPLYTSLGM